MKSRGHADSAPPFAGPEKAGPAPYWSWFSQECYSQHPPPPFLEEKVSPLTTGVGELALLARAEKNWLFCSPKASGPSGPGWPAQLPPRSTSRPWVGSLSHLPHLWPDGAREGTRHVEQFCRIPERSFGEGSGVRTNDSLQWALTSQAVVLKSVLHKTPRLPPSLRSIRRCWRDRKDGGMNRFCGLFILAWFGSNFFFYFLFLGMVQGWRADMEGIVMNGIGVHDVKCSKNQ